MKALTLLVGLGSFVLANALNPTQHVIKNLEYENQDYRILQNKNVKGYNVRIKNTPNSCEEGVQYSGYIDRLDTDDHFFFYFFESRSDPKNDPTMLWLNGGPGCSSMMGLWMELGPCQVNEFGNGTIRNPYSWNTAANVIFVDQPVNVGYSYGKSKQTNSWDAANNVYAFLQLFFTEFPQYREAPFHLSGESYGGHFLPSIAAQIIDYNSAIPDAPPGYVPLEIKLESVLIGNGWVEPRTQYKSYETYACAHDNIYKPVYDERTCQVMRSKAPRCEFLMNACYKYPNPLTCYPADIYCGKVYIDPFTKTGLNPFDIRKKCEGNSGLCYDLLEAIEIYANQEQVRKDLGVDDEAGRYTECNSAVENKFILNGDHGKDTSSLVARTLEAGVRVLLFVGDMDWNCNWFGNLEWSSQMVWSGKRGYKAAPFEKWYSDLTGKHAGDVKQFDNLTFLRVFDAGHLVPYDQPENSLDFLSKWLSSLPLSG